MLLSPGPGAPKEAGVCPDMVRHCAEARLPMLGVCLGHQALGEVYGATVTHASELMHGKTSLVRHDGSGVLEGLPSPFTATRYHSLAVVADTVPDELVITGRTEAARRAPAASSWRCATATCRCTASSSTPSRCSPRAVTGCWRTGSRCAATPAPPERSHGMAPLVRR